MSKVTNREQTATTTVEQTSNLINNHSVTCCSGSVTPNAECPFGKIETTDDVKSNKSEMCSSGCERLCDPMYSSEITDETDTWNVATCGSAVSQEGGSANYCDKTIILENPLNSENVSAPDLDGLQLNNNVPASMEPITDRVTSNLSTSDKSLIEMGPSESENDRSTSLNRTLGLTTVQESSSEGVLRAAEAIELVREVMNEFVDNLIFPNKTLPSFETTCNMQGDTLSHDTKLDKDLEITKYPPQELVDLKDSKTLTSSTLQAISEGKEYGEAIPQQKCVSDAGYTFIKPLMSELIKNVVFDCQDHKRQEYALHSKAVVENKNAEDILGHYSHPVTGNSQTYSSTIIDEDYFPVAHHHHHPYVHGRLPHGLKADIDSDTLRKVREPRVVRRVRIHEEARGEFDSLLRQLNLTERYYKWTLGHEEVSGDYREFRNRYMYETRGAK